MKPESNAVEAAERNIRLFILFRTLFNARFYYPVFAIIFLDFGLTLSQFALLNTLWAVTIILAEVPSGALADLVGRKKLMQLTSTLMVLEMGVWAFAPTGNPTLLLGCLAVNRILSGLAEAAASGADEALVYDSLKAAKLEHRWSEVLDHMTRWKSFGFVIAMVVGGVVYDQSLWTRLSTRWEALEQLPVDMVIRLPIILTFFSAIACWLVCRRMTDLTVSEAVKSSEPWLASLKQTREVGRWILATPFALSVIIMGAFADGTIRMFVTLASEYYRLIAYPEFALGIIGSAMGALNMVCSPLIKRVVERTSPRQLWVVVGGVGCLAFFGVSQFIPLVGIVFMLLLNVAFSLISFSLSYYLNQEATSSMRATVLSFKGLALNLNYGLMGVLYAGLLWHLRNEGVTDGSGDALFMASSQWFGPFYVVGVLMLLLATCSWFKRRKV
ncbi:MAG: hypothetical protein CBE26_04895 [Kiritimatiellaceae bacterium TMED266]|nr:MAG: hypothetical protein CBE26_04895 [Kiritimatiellaceae bacterium TMED266]